MNIQERIEALETEFNEKIKALKAEASQEQEFPQNGDTYYCFEPNGRIECFNWSKDTFDLKAQKLGNIFKTKEQAEFAAEKLKVEAELRKFSKPFESMEDNFFMVLDTNNGSLDIWCRLYSKYQGTIYFESEEKAQQVIDTVGADRIKKYIFGVED